MDDKGEFMKVGKISEVALSRAVFKQLKSKRDEVLFGGAIGEDCAAMRLGSVPEGRTMTVAPPSRV